MNASTPVRSPNYRWVVFTLLALAFLLVYFHRTCPAVVALDLMRDLDAGPALMGYLGSAYFYPYALMQLPAGLLSDTWGPRRSITVFFFLAGAASIAFALAESAGMAMTARVLVGLGVAMLFVPTMKILTRWFPVEQFAVMMGILMAVGGLGVLIAAEPLALLSQAMGWRGSFVAIGVITLVLAVAIWLFVRNTPEEMGLPPTAGVPQPGAAPAIGLKEGVRLVLTSRGFWPLAVWFFFTPGIFFSLGGLWGGPYLMQVYGLTKPQAGEVLNMLAWGMIFGSPLMSWISDKVLCSRKHLLIITALGLTALVIVLLVFTDSMGPYALRLWFLAFSLVSSAIVVVAFATAKELFPVQIAGTATGLVNLFPFMGGAILQLLAGIALESQAQAAPVTAYRGAFLIYLGSAVAALAASLFLKDTLPGRPARN
jgi:sugar phosphate permease